MQRITAMICAMLFIASLTACSENDKPITRAGGMSKMVTLSMITDGDGEIVDRPSYPLDTKTIPYRISNNTGEVCEIVLIPKLERNLGLQYEDKWEQIRFKDGVGFCGTPDAIDGGEIYDSEVDLSNFNNLPTGLYRLRFESFDRTNIISAEFVLQDEKKSDGGM